ncbi:MAG: class I SAM-dependent methyltransferase [Pseudomonadota bacterium]
MPDTLTVPEAVTGAETGFTCPACEAAVMRSFHKAEGVPTNSCILLDSPEEARAYPTGDIDLGFCDDCGFIFNMAFDLKKTEYSGRYEETQGFSGTFNAFHSALAQRLIDRHDLHDKDVLEIGCGKGEFLMLLAELGNNRGVGIDPGVHLDRINSDKADQLTFIADFYSEKYADHKVDFLACKMTLEHIPDAQNFVSTVRRGLGEQTDATVFFQIPEAKRVIGECAFEDVYYEHCAYFSPGTLARTFRQAGFDVLDLSVEYGDQYLTIEARPRASGAETAAPIALEDDLDELRAIVDSFPHRCAATLKKWRDLVETAKAADETIVLWGSGSKAVSFLTTLNVGDQIDYVTDINPYRHNHYMPITAQRIVPPSELSKIQPDLVIVMNRVYEQEVSADLQKLGVKARIVCL